MAGGKERVLCGIDEAGLGPLLGPLSIGYTAFAVRDGATPAPSARRNPHDLWKPLKKVVARKEGKQRRLVVADSKKVFHRNDLGWKRLERTVLSFLTLLDPDGKPPTSARALLFGDLHPTDRWIASHPWYADLPALPFKSDPGALELAGARLARECAAQGVRFLDGGVRVVPAGELNASFAETNNKGETVWRLVSEILRHLWTRHGEEDPDVTVDVLGGRQYYARPLAEAFPELDVRTLREDPEHSAYELVERDEDGTRWVPRRLRIAFRVRGEDASFAVALASCLAKYARELAMESLNGYFEARQKGLKPTAGYRGDASRWLADAAATIASTGLDKSVLVRER